LPAALPKALVARSRHAVVPHFTFSPWDAGRFAFVGMAFAVVLCCAPPLFWAVVIIFTWTSKQKVHHVVFDLGQEKKCTFFKA
jgi:hypothetical protein